MHTQAVPERLTTYGAAATAEEIATTKAALESKKHAVHVVKDNAAALAAVTSLLSKDKSIFLAGSGTLSTIGFTDFLKANPDATKRNIKGEWVAAFSTGDYATAGKLQTEGAIADQHYSSVDAISMEGDFTVSCLTGSRTAGFLSAGQVIIVAGSQKIVKDFSGMKQRQTEYSLAVESAHVKIELAAMGVTSSQAVNQVTITSSNPFGAPRFTIIIIEEAGTGY
jgi:hypothetical protein